MARNKTPRTRSAM